jgi:peptidoglycan/xylan/chitin deacetylase (PgdA/CDA1 family)
VHSNSVHDQVSETRIRRDKMSASSFFAGESNGSNGHTAWRELVVNGLYRTGALRMLEGVARSWELQFDSRSRLPRCHHVSTARFALLCYHRVGTKGIPFYCSLDPRAFEEQMRYLRERYRIISLGELCQEMNDPEARGQAVAVTFDDGYRDLYTNAFPILQKYKIPATIYLTAGAIESGSVSWYDRVFLALRVFPRDTLELHLDQRHLFLLQSHRARVDAATRIIAILRNLPDAQRRGCCAAIERICTLPSDELADRMLTWDQVREMSREGISFGSHTLTHPVVSRLLPSEMADELSQSKEILEKKIGCRVQDFAFPFGQRADCGEAAESVLAGLGYRSAATTCWGINRPGGNPFALSRVQIGEESSLPLFAFRLNQLFLRREEAESDNGRMDDSLGKAVVNAAPSPGGKG